MGLLPWSAPLSMSFVADWIEDDAALKIFPPGSADTENKIRYVGKSYASE